MKKYRIGGHSQYQPWQELRHATKSLCKTADAHQTGSAHVMTAAVVMAAFSVEAFCQTLGPAVLATTWNAQTSPVERKPIKEKLKLIGKAVGISVDYGKEPWAQVRRLIEARDSLAHAKPNVIVVDQLVELPDDADAAEHCRELLASKMQPFGSGHELETTMARIDKALLEINVAAGGGEHDLIAWGMATWHATVIA